MRFILPLLLSSAVGAAVEYIEPVVQRHAGVLPLSVCKQLIDLGEEAGFLVDYESIDVNVEKSGKRKHIPSQTIDVYDFNSDGDDDGDDEEIENAPIWEALQPYLPKITNIVKQNRNKEEFSKIYPDDPNREPVLNWIFFRKYSPDDDRNSLKHHRDTNMNTLNIELSNDYEGGGLFYIKPTAGSGELADKYDDAGYDWVDNLKRENTSDIVFPNLEAGDAVFYNYTVEHGVAPVESGTRYSMAFFFDMSNPAARGNEDDDEDDDLEEGEFRVELRNAIPGIELDIVQILPGLTEEDEVWEMKFEGVISYENVDHIAREGDRLRALKAGTSEKIIDMIMKENKIRYIVSPAYSGGGKLLEPSVQRHVSVLPKTVCDELIRLGDNAGFLVDFESIDEDEQNEAKEDPTKKYIPSQTIDVYKRGSDPTDDDFEAEIGNEAIWEVLQPWIPKITNIVKENRNMELFSRIYPDNPNREPDLNWIFFRKYSPNDERNSLQHHHDTNMNTVNIELSSDYKGGGLFYIKPLANTLEINQHVKDEIRGYAGIDSIKRKNTSDIIFPDLYAGDAVFYNYTVEHGVAPVESGTRYSMAFFFDMDNPILRKDHDEDILEEGEFKVKLQNELNMELDIVQVLPGTDDDDEVWEMKFDNVTFNETFVFRGYEGDRLRALRAGTVEAVISDIEIKPDKSLYTISRAGSVGALKSEL